MESFVLDVEMRIGELLEELKSRLRACTRIMR